MSHFGASIGSNRNASYNASKGSKGRASIVIPTALKDKFAVLWVGGLGVDELVDVISGNNIIVTDSDFTSAYIPADSSATFSLPDVAALKTADTDNLWYDGGGTAQQLTVTDLVGTDYERTVVKYANFEPYNIAWIGLMKSGEAFEGEILDTLHRYFQLWILWAGTINNYGVLKDNRTLG